jgi:hypothetical protein
VLELVHSRLILFKLRVVLSLRVIRLLQQHTLASGRRHW